MQTPYLRFKRAVTSLLAGVWISGSAWAASPDLDALYGRLADPDLTNWHQVEEEIWQKWAQSGSATADLLLERGRGALEKGEPKVAAEHFTALIDHFPDFAEGYNGRATAYYQLGLYGPALDDIRATLVLNPKHFGAITGLALILEEMGHPEEALGAYRAVAAIHPHRPDVQEALERLEQETGDAAL